MAFVGGLLIGNIIGFIIASLCYISSEFRDDEDFLNGEEYEEEGK